MEKAIEEVETKIERVEKATEKVETKIESVEKQITDTGAEQAEVQSRLDTCK